MDMPPVKAITNMEKDASGSNVWCCLERVEQMRARRIRKYPLVLERIGVQVCKPP